MTWTLYFEPDVTMLSPRQARDAIDAINEPAEVPWQHTLKGTRQSPAERWSQPGRFGSR